MGLLYGPAIWSWGHLSGSDRLGSSPALFLEQLMFLGHQESGGREGTVCEVHEMSKALSVEPGTGQALSRWGQLQASQGELTAGGGGKQAAWHKVSIRIELGDFLRLWTGHHQP